MNERLKALEDRIASGQDGAMVRFAVGRIHLEADQPAEAIVHLSVALEKSPDYSAAWALLGKAHVSAGNNAEAIEIYRKGIEVSERKGDLQLAKQMRVFLRRLGPSGS